MVLVNETMGDILFLCEEPEGCSQSTHKLMGEPQKPKLRPVPVADPVESATPAKPVVAQVDKPEPKRRGRPPKVKD